MKFKIYTLVLFTCFFSSNINAALISSDWQATGDNYITQDTNSGLNWLDITLTTGRSYNDISSQLVSGGEFSSFRYATADEVLGLFTAAGLVEHGREIAGDELLISNLQNLIGITDYSESTDFIVTRSLGITSELTSSGCLPICQHHATLLIQSTSQSTVTIVDANGTGAEPDGTDEIIGSYLVYDTAVVPVPAAVWLFGTGLIGLIGIARRKA